MKNRIDQLREQCAIECMGVRQFDEQKFAELLIRECLEAIEKTPKHLAHTTYELSLMSASIREVSETVKRHFQM